MVRSTFKVCAALWILICALGTTIGSASAQADSAYGVYVQDDAGILTSQTKETLYSRALWLNEQTGTAQIGIVTVDSLDNRSLEEYAVSRFREMGLGDGERNDGVLLLYSASDHHVRIEVGYGLEGRIPDGKAGAILDQYFVPNRDAGQMDQAFTQTQSALIQEVAAEYGVDASGIVDGNMPSVPDQESGGFFDGMPGYVKVLLGIGAVFLIFLDFKFTGGAVTYSILNLIGRRGSGGGGYGSGRGGGRGGGGSSGGGGASR